MKIIMGVVLILNCFVLQAQINFENLSLNAAIEKASKTGQLVFAQFVSESCGKCNEVAESAFKNKELGDYINKNFIPIKIDGNLSRSQDFVVKYNPAAAFGTFFISGDGDLVYSYLKNTSWHMRYIKEATKAQEMRVEGQVTLQELDKEWNNNPSNLAAMSKNLEKRLLLGLKTDSLLEIFVARLPVDTFPSGSITRFIATLAPSIFSEAHKILHADVRQFNKQWYLIPLKDRVSINNRIIQKSMHKAIGEKDYEKAKMVAKWRAMTYAEDNPSAMQKTYEKQMLDFYWGIKDTTYFLPAAVKYYEKYYMNISVDSLKSQDYLGMQEGFNLSTPATASKSVGNVDSKITQSFKFVPKSQFYTGYLNTGAWQLYTITKNAEYLLKALAFAKRANEFYPSPEALDTYARLLYVTGEKKEAILNQEKAIELLLERNFSITAYQVVLGRIKNGMPLDDLH